MNNTDLCRNNLYKRLVIDTIAKHNPQEVAIEINQMTSSLEELVDLARPRLIKEAFASKWKHQDLMDYMQAKLDGFKETGNFELMVDLINFVAVEKQLKTHPTFHFNSLDRQSLS